MPFLLAIDQGTTSSRTIIFNDAGAPVASAQQEFTQHYPSPGLVEHDAQEIWNTQLQTIERAMRDAGIGPCDLAGIGITNQRETAVVWDRATGVPICNAIVWQDRRTAEHCDRLRADGLAPMIREKTGLELDAYFSATKIAWILDNISGARERAERGELAFGTIDSWLAWKLTGGAKHITDTSNASRTMLFDINTLKWDEQLLALFDIPRAILPEVVESSGTLGEATEPCVKGVPIAAIIGDQQSALAGQLCVREHLAKSTYGTGAFMLTNTGGAPVASSNRLLTTVGWTRDGRTTYALEGAVFIAGAVVQWLRDGLGFISSSAEIESLANSVPDSGGVSLVPAFAGLGAPHWDQHARGIITGLTRGTTRAHIARAAIEAIAFQAADLLGAMREDSGAPIDELRVDGGASRNNALMQFQADILRIPVVRPVHVETTAFGAACLAGLATGVWPDWQSLERTHRIERTFEPGISDDEAQARRAEWADAVGRAKSGRA